MKTPATEFLRLHGVSYTEHPYEYVEHGGAGRGADELGVPAAEVVKTLVMQDEQRRSPSSCSCMAIARSPPRTSHARREERASSRASPRWRSAIRAIRWVEVALDD